MPNLNEPFQSYMLRYWAESTDGDGGPVWRFSLVGLEDKRRIGFADLQQLVAWLSEQTQSTNQTENENLS